MFAEIAKSLYKDVTAASRRIESGQDKAAVLDRLLLKAAARQSQSGPGLAVYIGDSMSDLAPLLAADVGIVIGQNRLLRRVAAAAGISLRPLVCGAALDTGHSPCDLKVMNCK